MNMDLGHDANLSVALVPLSDLSAWVVHAPKVTTPVLYSHGTQYLKWKLIGS